MSPPPWVLKGPKSAGLNKVKHGQYGLSGFGSPHQLARDEHDEMNMMIEKKIIEKWPKN